MSPSERAAISIMTPNRHATPFRGGGKETFILRTRSMDEEGSHAIDHHQNRKEQLASSLPVASLHTSFDAALLKNTEEGHDGDKDNNEAIFRSTSIPRVSLAASSWDEPESVRKLRHRSVNNPNHHANEVTVRKTRQSAARNTTPGRPLRHPTVPQSSTPGSSSRRRKAAPLQHRKCKSPFHQTRGVSLSSSRPPREQTPTSSLKHASDSTATALFHSTPIPHPPKSKTAMHTGNYTASTHPTVNSSLDFTIDTPTTDQSGGSHESPGVTFRFTSFPASLPRVHPRSPYCPTAAAKNPKKSFRTDQAAVAASSPLNNSTSSVSEHATALKRARPMINIASEEGHNNSSLSSMSGELQQPSLVQVVPSFPSGTSDTNNDLLEWWKSPQHDALARRGNVLFDHSSKNSLSEDSSDLILEPRQTVAPKTNAKLFLDTDYSYSDEDESPLRPIVPRTRLNFNLVTSPNGSAEQESEVHGSPTKGDGNTKEPHDGIADAAVTATDLGLSKPYVPEHRVNSYLSTSSTLTSRTEHDQATSSTGSTLSPARPTTVDNCFHPTSPTEMQFRFHLDEAQCSPILNRDEAMSIRKDSMDVCDSHALTSERCLSPVAELVGTSLAANQSVDSTTKLSLSQESSGSSSSNSSKQRRLRPMPDMSAFETGGGGGSVRSAASRHSDDISSPSSAPASPKLTCPPTPVRTPAWAHSDKTTNPFVRANSLIVTKVLATCPVRVVDGHSSLENSTMEEDSVVGDIEKRRASLSFSTVDEEMEEVRDPGQQSSGNSSTPPPGGLQRLPINNNSHPLRELGMNPTTPFATQTYPIKAAVSKPSATTTNEDVTVSFGTNFHNLGKLGSGAFADVYKVRSKTDCQLYAVKRNRRQFRGKRDRDMAMAEVRTMQTLQSTKQKTNYSLYVLFFYRAWQEEGYFYCQTELCCRDTCCQLMESLRSNWPSAVTKYPSLSRHLGDQKPSHLGDVAIGRLVPDATVWKIFHDVAAGLSHIHAHGIVHHDIKPSNIFFVRHDRLGAMCKIGDFGMAGDIGTAEDGQEGDTVYMPPELLSSSVKQPGADIFSLGLTLYELAAAIGWELPSEGPQWHELRSGAHVPKLPPTRHADLRKLIQSTISADNTKRPSADDILNGIRLVKVAGSRCDDFLKDYLQDVATNDRIQEEDRADPEQTPRNMEQRELRTPTPGIPLAPLIFTPTAHP